MFRRIGIAWMAVLVLGIVGCAATYTSSPPPSIAPDAVLSTSSFYDQLAPYGRWVDVEPYGWCWTPYDVTSDWRPYVDGRWDYTDVGWTWDSNEPWGWATCHYGRWLANSDYGWVWVPGSEWAPAWVAWRMGDDWVGWAALPPNAEWNGASGLQYSVDVIPSDAWCFVRTSDLVDRDVHPHVVSVARNSTLIAATSDQTRYELQNGRPVNLGIDVDAIDRASGRPVPRLKVVDSGGPRRGQDAIGAGAVGMFRPAIHAPEPGAAPRPEFRAGGAATNVDPGAARRGQDAERRRFEASIAQERAALDREHQREAAERPPNMSADDLHRRQQSEQQAFDQHAQQMRRVFDTRWRNAIVRPGPGNGRATPRPQPRPNEARAGEP